MNILKKHFLQENWSTIWFYGIILINVFFVSVTLFRSELEDVFGSRIVGTVLLTFENNIAAWWSGVLLLIVSIHSLDGFFRLREHRPSAARGWALLAFILFTFSADEIGSIHERIIDDFPFGFFNLAVPGIIVLAVLAYAFLSLWFGKENRVRISLLALGFMFFASVVVQEQLERRIDWGSFSALRNAVEEGTELLGMTIILKSAMSNTRGIFNQSRFGAYPTFEVINYLRLPIFAALAVSVVVIALITANLSDQLRGHPADWLASTLFAFAAFAVSMRFIKYREDIGVLNWCLIGLCCLASVSAVFLDPFTIQRDNFFMDQGIRIPLLTAVTLLIGAIWVASPNYEKRDFTLPVIAIAVIGLSALVFEASLLSIYMMTQFLGLLVLYVNYVNSTRYVNITIPQQDYIER